ncbi:MAG: hypothetical protein ACXWX5_12395 [Actinomycetota bacterium]
MSKVEELRVAFRASRDPEAFIREHSNLPGPRGNLELAEAVALEGDEALFRRLVAWDPDRAGVNTPEGFLSVCGVVGLGELRAHGRTDVLPELRAFASDPRWRTREAVAMALQRWGRRDMGALLVEMRRWAGGNHFEQRAAAAGLCEPDLLREPGRVRSVLVLLDRMTRSIGSAPDRTSTPFRVLRKALGYCWSVAIAASPADGIVRFDRWAGSDDPDVRWIVRENLKKKRLAPVGGADAERWRKRVGAR